MEKEMGMTMFVPQPQIFSKEPFIPRSDFLCVYTPCECVWVCVRLLFPFSVLLCRRPQIFLTIALHHYAISRQFQIYQFLPFSYGVPTLSAS